MKLRIGFPPAPSLLLALTLSVSIGAPAHSGRTEYSERLMIQRTPNGPVIEGLFDKYGAGSPILRGNCSQSAAASSGDDKLREQLVQNPPPPPGNCQHPHCNAGGTSPSDCTTFKKPYLIDCGQGCAAYVCDDNQNNTCCVECTRTDGLCFGCKTTGYCN
jgi:hypothetical protein